jgi:predicted nucleotidyltransferase
MSQQELLKKVIHVLDQLGIQYMITGSVVSSLQGEPRSTHDIDIVVAIQSLKVHELINAFPAVDFYLDKDGIYDAINEGGMFNLLDLKSGDKVDFWLLTDDPFDRSRFSRKYSEEFMGLKLQVSTPEDTILAKLRWAKLSGGSEKQFVDALRVYEVQYGKLDLDYLEQWAKRLSIDYLWKRLLKEAEIVG